MKGTIEQNDLFGGALFSRVASPVNIASVTQRSPFRYPGGKTWLVPHVRKWLKSLDSVPTDFVEPFVGGGIISLTVAAERLADRVTMVELDKQVAAVWHTIINDNEGLWLADRIATFDISTITPDELRNLDNSNDLSRREQAFKTILKNRTFHGGILAPGSGPIKHGENGKGIASRWYPETLRKRIVGIDHTKERIDFIEGDGLEVLRHQAAKSKSVFFIDPPYSVAGKGKSAGRRLYSCFELDHHRLFELTSKIAGDFLMTYDNADEVLELAKEFGFDTEPVAMKNTHHAEMTELLIGRNLDWARRRPRTRLTIDAPHVN